jgi:TonB family protein
MRAEEAASPSPNQHNLDQPLQNRPPVQNGFGITGDGAQTDGAPALPRRGYPPHARPPGAKAGRTRPSGADLVFLPDPSALPLFTSLLNSAVHPPWYRSLAGAFRREHLPPLELTSKPVPVPSIWGIYDFRKRSLLSSTVAHIALVVLLATAISRSTLPRILPQSIDLSIPVEIARFLPNPAESGGGGGGDSPLPASEGDLPRFQLIQLAPPRPQAMNVEPRLTVTPSLLSAKDMKANVLDLALLGSPLHEVSPPSAGTGTGGGLGGGEGSGVGSGKGSGFGSDKGAGTDGIFEVGGEVSAPILRVQVDPEYSEQARVQRLQGAVLLSIEVWPDGRAHNVRIVRGLGMGLDQRAVEAVRKWEFEPGYKDGEPVRVICRVEVIFTLF